MFDMIPKMSLPRKIRLLIGSSLDRPSTCLSANESNSEFAHHAVVLETIDGDRFRKIEKVPQNAPRSLEKQQCEEHFRATRTSEELCLCRPLTAYRSKRAH